MPMNTVIQERRKALGFTQEQVAAHLNVSIPAVSKWENGTTSPDISLLAPLARLLKTDLNTLLCFHEDLTDREIGLICKEISELVQTKGIGAGVAAAEQKLREYPHSETLLHTLTFQLDGLLTLSALPSGEKALYEEEILSWYRRLAESREPKISKYANFMIAGKLIRKGEYEKAQEVLDRMPDSETMLDSTTDKLMLQVILYQKQGKAEKAAADLQNALLMNLNKVQTLLCKLIDAELAAGEVKIAKEIADKACRMPELFDLWAYTSFVAPLQIAVTEKDTDACLSILRKTLAALLTPWDPGDSPLFHRITMVSDPAQMLPAILSEMENDPEYAFLQDQEAFKELVADYKKLLK